MSMHTLRGVLAFLVLDLVWIGLVAGPQYRPMIRDVQGAPMHVRWPYALFAYAGLGLALATLVLPNVSQARLVQDGMRWGVLVGGIVYCVYTCTAASMLRAWTGSVVVSDILWGAVSFTLAAWASGGVR